MPRPALDTATRPRGIPPPPPAPRTPRNSEEAAEIRAAYGVAVRRRSLESRPALASALGAATASAPLERLPLRLLNHALSFLELREVVSSVSVSSRSMFSAVCDARYWKQVEAATFRGALPKPSLLALLTKLRRATLDGVEGTEAEAGSLARACRGLESLRVLRAPALTDQGLAALAAACPSLRRVELRFCPRVTDAGVEALVARSGRALEEVTLAACRGIGNGAALALARGAPRLAALDLANSAGLDDSGVAALAGAPCGATLRRLNFAACGGITSGALEALGAARCPRLEHLSLFACRVDDAGVAALGPLPALRKVNLVRCASVSDEAADALAARGVEVVRQHYCTLTRHRTAQPQLAAALVAEAAGGAAAAGGEEDNDGAEEEEEDAADEDDPAAAAGPVPTLMR